MLIDRKRIGIIGATGSIGTQAIDVISANKDKYEVAFITANSNKDSLDSLAKKVDAKKVLMTSDSNEHKLLMDTINHDNVDIVLLAVVGASAIPYAIHTLNNGITLALANKECIVCAGDILFTIAKQKNAKIIPVDSEHSAIFQCLQGENSEAVSKIYLTASGGPFFNLPASEFMDITLERALKHPNWSMGQKITIDSATMMNKGLEMIEAKHLFSLKNEQIEVTIHPQSIIHSYVTFVDGSMKAQLGSPDMRVPIAYSFSYPDRVTLSTKEANLATLGSLTFFEPDYEKFHCLKIAKHVMGLDNPLVNTVMNASNEVAVEAFLNRKIHFTDIPKIIEKTLTMMEPYCIINKGYGIDDVYEVDYEARRAATGAVAHCSC